jgi:transposase
VTDKGFYSGKNVEKLVESKCGFLMAVPFSNGWAKDLVNAERGGIDRASNVVITSGSAVRGVSRKIDFAGSKLTAHLFYNPELEIGHRNDLYEFASYLKKLVEAGAPPVACKKDADKYLIIKKNNSVQIRENVIEREIEFSGWFLMLGNGNITAQKAHDIYSKKDVVEKAFMKYKNLLGFHRLCVHSDIRMKNKLFVGFIAMTVISHSFSVPFPFVS